MDFVKQFCPSYSCAVRNERPVYSNRRGDIRVDTSTRLFAIADTNTLIPAGNQAQAEVESQYAGSLLLQLTPMVIENAKMACSGRFERGKVALTASGTGNISVTYRLIGSASARFYFISVGGSRSASITVSAPVDVADMGDPIEVDFTGKTVTQVNSELEVASNTLSLAILEQLDEELSEKFSFDRVQLIREVARVAVPLEVQPRAHFLFMCSACFPEGVSISTPDGDRAIETIRAGDKVFSLNPVTGKIVTAEVASTVSHENVELLELVVKTQSGKRRVLMTTLDHPYFINSDFTVTTPAVHLKKGDMVHVLRNGKLETETVESARRTRHTSRTYNFHVPGYFNYFADGILVHNKNL